MRLFTEHAIKSYVLGFDLGEETSQISFMRPDEKEPSTLSLLAGKEQYNIPTILYKRHGVAQWFYGKEAQKQPDDGQGTKITNLLQAARKEEEITVEDVSYDPVTLLTLFVKRALSLLSFECSIDHVSCLVFTTRNLDKRMVEILSAVTDALHLKVKQIFYQSYEESFFYYMLYQPPELKFKHILACDYRYAALEVYDLVNNYHTKPIVASVEKYRYEQMRLPFGRLPKDAMEYHRVCRELDESFYAIMRRLHEEKEITTVYLLGDGFKDNWAKESLEFLCKDARVFQGNNLFSKGAAIAARERIAPRQECKGQLLLGKDKLKANLGMHLKKQGTVCYYALMDAGVNWYEVHALLDIILEEGNELQIEKTPLNGSDPSSTLIVLEGLPSRPKGTTRLRLTLDMTDERTVRIRVKDLGFGSVFPTTNMHWEEQFLVSQ